MPTFVSSQMLQDSVLPRFYRLDCFHLDGKIYKKWNGLTLVFTFHLHGRQYANVNESMLNDLGWSKKDLEQAAFRNLLKLNIVSSL